MDAIVSAKKPAWSSDYNTLLNTSPSWVMDIALDQPATCGVMCSCWQPRPSSSSACTS
uniref:AlNc14C77G5131 protein n=1 Tax=Albugo laibachii Nc14 TaxID=890382 RepID=F0WET1_9STRA|nr:AlNc14C77G5131 [Albugo laibachii Nc14]|eukprot:CCA19713.1 AlNc14C77G5131 [Albugo laibachii Nc14]